MTKGALVHTQMIRSANKKQEKKYKKIQALKQHVITKFSKL